MTVYPKKFVVEINLYPGMNVLESLQQVMDKIKEGYLEGPIIDHEKDAEIGQYGWSP